MPYKKQLDEIGAYLISKKYTVAVAESVTSGLIQNAFSSVVNASAFFEGGITAYNLRQKCTHLLIDPTHAIRCNCVSEQVAEEMALGVAKSFHSNWGIAITGYASPLPELGVNELYACYAFVFDKEVKKRATVPAVIEAPDEVQLFYLRSVLEDFIQICTRTGK